jgi:hypothetical protein
LEIKLEFKNVPKSILAWLERTVIIVREFNEGILRMRSLESMVGNSGRYEYEYRCANSVAGSLDFIKSFRAEAPVHGVDPEAVLSALGYEEPLTESQASAQWRRDDSAEEQDAFKDELKPTTE